MSLKAQYEQLSLTKTENGLIRLKQSYDQGEKPGKLLAQSKLDSDMAINVIQTPNGTLSTDPGVINETFTSHYTTLHTSGYPESTDNQKEFLNKQAIPSIDEDTTEQIDRKLDVSEIPAAITDLRGGKIAGPGGKLQVQMVNCRSRWPPS